MSDTIIVKGLKTFKPHEKAPDFVKGTLMITPNQLVQFIKENEQYLTEYKGEKQLKCQILEGDYGLYFTVDTYKPESKPKEDFEIPDKSPAPQDNTDEDDGLPF